MDLVKKGVGAAFEFLKADDKYILFSALAFGSFLVYNGLTSTPKANPTKPKKPKSSRDPSSSKKQKPSRNLEEVEELSEDLNKNSTTKETNSTIKRKGVKGARKAKHSNDSDSQKSLISDPEFKKKHHFDFPKPKFYTDNEQDSSRKKSMEERRTKILKYAKDDNDKIFFNLLANLAELKEE